MGEGLSKKPGEILWVDLTVPDAGEVKDFYAEVIGWVPQPVDVGGYDDYNSIMPEKTIAQRLQGFCNKSDNERTRGTKREPGIQEGLNEFSRLEKCTRRDFQSNKSPAARQ